MNPTLTPQKSNKDQNAEVISDNVYVKKKEVDVIVTTKKAAMETKNGGGSGGGGKKGRKKMQRLDPRVLGFTVHADATRTNIGEIDMVPPVHKK